MHLKQKLGNWKVLKVTCVLIKFMENIKEIRFSYAIDDGG